MATDKLDEMRSILEDLVSMAKKLQPICTTTDELIQVCELATTNDAQLKLIMKEAIKK